MSQSDLPEEKIQKLLICLLKQFEAKHGTQTNKLSSCIFFLTDTNGCARSSGLISSRQGQTEDGQIVQIGESGLYVDAIKELEHRGYVQRTSLNYTLTVSGYEKATELSMPKASLKMLVISELRSAKFIVDTIKALIFFALGVMTTWFLKK